MGASLLPATCPWRLLFCLGSNSTTLFFAVYTYMVLCTDGLPPSSLMCPENTWAYRRRRTSRHSDYFSRYMPRGPDGAWGSGTRPVARRLVGLDRPKARSVHL